MTNRDRSEGFRVGHLVRATRNAQGLRAGSIYRVADRKAFAACASVFVSYIVEERGATHARFEVRNLPLLAERFFEE